MAEAQPDSAVADLATARALIATLRAELTTIQRENASLRHQLDVRCQRMVGKKSERVDPRQLQLALEQLANESGPVTEPIEMDSGETPVRGHERRRATGRRSLPAHLPRQRVEIDVADADKVCGCGHAKTRMGESVSEKLEYQPASFVVLQTARAKYACPAVPRGRHRSPRAAASRGQVARRRGAAGAGGHLEIRRSPTAASPVRHLRATARRSGAHHVVRLDRGGRHGARPQSGRSSIARSPPRRICKPTTRR